jgi:hypothetical protein
MMRVTNVASFAEGAVWDLPDGTRLERLSPSSEDAYSVMKGTILREAAFLCIATPTLKVFTYWTAKWKL